ARQQRVRMRWGRALGNWRLMGNLLVRRIGEAGGHALRRLAALPIGLPARGGRVRGARPSPRCGPDSTLSMINWHNQLTSSVTGAATPHCRATLPFPGAALSIKVLDSDGT